MKATNLKIEVIMKILKGYLENDIDYVNIEVRPSDVASRDNQIRITSATGDKKSFSYHLNKIRKTNQKLTMKTLQEA